MILSQVNEDGNRHPIQYTDIKMKKAERNYSACEREALAAVFALKKFRMYLLSSIPFVINTDQKALKSAFAKQDIHGRLARWLDFLAEYEFELEHCRGVVNWGPDFLSRILHGEKGDGEEEGDIVSLLIALDELMYLNLKEELREVA